MIYLSPEQGVEPHGESDDKEGADDGELEEGLHDVGEHDDVDAEKGKLADVGEEVEPGHGDADGAHLPLPVLPQPGLLGAGAEVTHQEDGRHVATQLDHILHPDVVQMRLKRRRHAKNFNADEDQEVMRHSNGNELKSRLSLKGKNRQAKSTVLCKVMQCKEWVGLDFV